MRKRSNRLYVVIAQYIDYDWQRERMLVAFKSKREADTEAARLAPLLRDADSQAYTDFQRIQDRRDFGRADKDRAKRRAFLARHRGLYADALGQSEVGYFRSVYVNSVKMGGSDD